MATGDTAPPPLAIPPPPIEPLSDDDGSSPLSDVEDKDGDPDGLHGLDNLAPAHRDEEASSADELSDANDTEAETERLYDTPRNPTRHKDVILRPSADEQVHERTPSKLRQQTTTATTTIKGAEDDDDEPLSEEAASIASSPPAQVTEASKDSKELQSPTLDLLAEAANQEAESRKRKRSSMPVENSEPPQPLRKRTSSVPTPSRQDADGDTAMADEEEPSTNTNSGEHSADEGVNVAVAEEVGDEPAREAQSDHETQPKKQTRSGSKKLKGSEQSTEGDRPPEGGVDKTAPEEATHAGDDEHAEADVDGEAEAAHKNEEELERKKAAFEQLSGIEKRFTTFRDRLYEERLEQLNQEEAMLRADTPTHPEYLAMMQCVDARKEDRLRVADRELELKMESLGRWAVARRAQIHSQFFQSVRESRERILAELGQSWYDIQHERRKQANSVPEFGLQFPDSQTQRVRNALSYNKEVSILSGIAKYEGMPAAPEMKGASIQELDEDFEAMNRSRQPPTRHQVHRPNYVDYGGLPFGQALGPAGEQFLEQTPWANPNHPSNAHLLHQRQQSAQHEPQVAHALPSASSGSGRQSHQPHSVSKGSTSQPTNGNTKAPKSAPQRQPSTSPEVTRAAASLLEQTKARGMKALSGAETAVKQESRQAVGSL
ncbi:Sds3-like-domain-containing protein [Whalleya microplaca]|nr:Sds3-like-domain-containing protein [Whalleya microplaca]